MHGDLNLYEMQQVFVIFIFIAGIVLSVSSCGTDCHDCPVPGTGDTTLFMLDLGVFPVPEIADDNPLTVQGVKLGRMLFYEKMLSGDNTQSCGSCHQQQFAFTDSARFSLGIAGLKGKRNSMSVFNLAWHTNEFFWDGRAHLLRDQSLFPIQDELEMDETLENVVAELSDSELYRDQFERTFGSDEISPVKISKALEQFMNSIVSNQSRFDMYLKGEITLTESEERGRVLFSTEFNPLFPELSGPDCIHCHVGHNFENDKYINNGLDDALSLADTGREQVTDDPDDRGRFKVTSLRNIALTAPYMHDGRFKTLEEVIDHYDHGVKASATLDPALEKRRMLGGLKLDKQEKADLVAFLRTLTDEVLITNPAYSDPF